jgi:glycosyltransferase involved in cell wall biosynthesis
MNENPSGPFAVISSTLPPATNGQAVMLGRILRGLPAENYRLILTEKPFGKSTSVPLAAEVHSVATPAYWQPSRLPGIGGLMALANYAIVFFSRTRQLGELLRKFRCRRAVVCTGHIFDLPTAWIASRKARIPLIVYAFDFYAYQFDAVGGFLGLLIRAFARLAERVILPRTELVIVPNEFLQNEYAKRYHVRTVIVRNPLDFNPDSMSQHPWPAAPDSIRLAYTGSVYTPQIQSLRLILQALENDVTGRIRLALLTPQTPDELAAMNITGRVDHLGCLNHEATREAQSRADVLVLPFGFDTPYPTIIRTSAPGKLAEYLASGRPILVIAPPDSFLVWYFERHRCGWVVAEKDPARILSVIDEIIASPDERAERCRRAFQCAQRDFALDVARRTFLGAVQN